MALFARVGMFIMLLFLGQNYYYLEVQDSEPASPVPFKSACFPTGH